MRLGTRPRPRTEPPRFASCRTSCLRRRPRPFRNCAERYLLRSARIAPPKARSNEGLCHTLRRPPETNVRPRPRIAQRGGPMSRLLTVAGGLIAALAIATLTVTASAPGAGRPLYLNRHASIESRVNDLLP